MDLFWLKRLWTNEKLQWKLVRIMGFTSCVFMTTLGIFCFVDAVKSERSSSFAFAFSCILDCSGAMVIIWRSYSVDSPNDAHVRELRAQTILGFLFWLAALSVLCRALVNLNEITGLEYETRRVYILLGTGCGAQVFFFVTKMPLALCTGSSSLVADAVYSLAACFLAAMSIVVTVLENHVEKLEILDDLVSVVISLLIGAYGSCIWYSVWVDPSVSHALPFWKPAPLAPAVLMSKDNEREYLLPSSVKDRDNPK